MVDSMTSAGPLGPPSVETMRFGGLRIDFDDSVLRPRPWTTAQSYWSAELLRDAPAGPVLELCAGAGQIGLLAIAELERDLVLVDIDSTACRFARANARRAGLANRVVVRHAALEDALTTDERFVFVIADPPWVPSGHVGTFPRDPLLAIDGGPDGLGPAWACLNVIAAHLVEDGSAIIQLGSDEQVGRMRERLRTDRGLGLDIVESRSVGRRGVLVLLARAMG